jgi:6-pyruvoyltetrahydropterin/6-carboxytetrahydropterin synthase
MVGIYTDADGAREDSRKAGHRASRSPRATKPPMRTRLERNYRFEAAHFLPKVPPGHKCARMHGHSYEITIAIEGEVDRELGWLVDFAAIDERALPLVRELDHRVLNELPGLDNPTSELLAAWWWQRLHATLPDVVEVVVSETPTSRCIYRGQ